MFNFWNILHTIFHGGCTSLHSHQCRTRVPVFPFSSTLVSFCFFARSQPKGCEVTAHGFDLQSLKISGIEHLFICLLA